MTVHEARAIEAYLRHRGTEPPITLQTVEIRNKSYVVLSGVRNILAVYRVKPDGYVRRLVRYPRALNRMV